MRTQEEILVAQQAAQMVRSAAALQPQVQILMSSIIDTLEWVLGEDDPDNSHLAGLVQEYLRRKAQMEQ